MNDQIETLRQFLETGPVSFVAGKQYVTVPADELRAALSAREGGGQHAEAGAVATAWIEPYHLGALRKRRENKEAGYILVEVCDSETEDYCVPLFLHPAQPASQQGEVAGWQYRRAGSSDAWTNGTDSNNHQRNTEESPEWETRLVYALSHPTGDKVQIDDALMALRSEETFLRIVHGDNTADDHMEAVRVLAAALDQEKGR